MKHEMNLVIQETDLDVFGHVNNAAYLRLFENARWEFITEQGVGLKEIFASGIGPVILEVQVRFKKELKARDQVKILSEFGGFEGKTAKIRQTMVNARGEEACQAEFLIAVFDIKARKIISPPDQWLKMSQS
jgi:acyl-CoA thioester hydrolase